MKTIRKGLWVPAITALLLAFMGGCKDEKVGKVGVCPVVQSTDPTNLATGVPLDKTIKIVFSEAMNPATITPAAFSLQGSASGGSRRSGGSNRDKGASQPTRHPSGRRQ